MAKASTDPVDAGFKRAVADGDLARSFRTWAHTFITKAMAVASGLLVSSGEKEADWVKPAARFANFQATSAAAGAKGVEESKGEESKFDQLLAAMAKQAAQTEAGLSQMRETQAQSQQAQTNMMQMLGMIFAGQEQQRLQNDWVTTSITGISASSGCVIEAAPEPQTAIKMPPALVRLAAGTDPDVLVTEATSATAVDGSTAPAAGVSGGGAAAPPSNANKRNAKGRSSNGGAASSTVAAIQQASGTPPRKRSGLPPGHDMSQLSEEMDGLGDDDGDDVQRDGDTTDGEAGTATPNGMAKTLQCLYAGLYGNPKRTKAQMMATRERERSPYDVEADAKRVEEELLGGTPPPQDF